MSAWKTIFFKFNDRVIYSILKSVQKFSANIAVLKEVLCPADLSSTHCHLHYITLLEPFHS